MEFRRKGPRQFRSGFLQTRRTVRALPRIETKRKANGQSSRQWAALEARIDPLCRAVAAWPCPAQPPSFRRGRKNRARAGRKARTPLRLRIARRRVDGTGQDG